MGECQSSRVSMLGLVRSQMKMICYCVLLYEVGFASDEGTKTKWSQTVIASTAAEPQVKRLN